MSKISDFREYELIKTAYKNMTRLVNKNPEYAKFFNTNISVYLDNDLELHKRKVEYAKQVNNIVDLIKLREYVQYANTIYAIKEKSVLSKIIDVKKHKFTLNINPLKLLDNIANDALQVYADALDTIQFDEDVAKFNKFVKSHKLRKNLTMPSYKKFTLDELEELECKNIKYYAKEHFKTL